MRCCMQLASQVRNQMVVTILLTQVAVTFKDVLCIKLAALQGCMFDGYRHG